MANFILVPTITVCAKIVEAVKSCPPCEGDWKDSAKAKEQRIIETLGGFPDDMPCADASPRAFNRWLSMVFKLAAE